jgi:hypothetical protein
MWRLRSLNYGQPMVLFVCEEELSERVISFAEDISSSWGRIGHESTI